MNIYVTPAPQPSNDILSRAANLVDSATEAGIEAITDVFEKIMAHFGEDRGMAVAS